MRRSTVALLVAVVVSVGCSRSPEAEGPAYAWHDSVLAAMGGQDAWEETRYISFRWNVVREGQVISDRLHHWDRWNGRYRLETTVDGDSLLALLDVESRDGRVWLAGQEVTGARADSLVERAYAMFINDSYWLLMPYKWRDPGVNLEYLGEETHDDGTWQVLHLSFGDVGLTPGDQYWAYVDDRAPHLMRKWQYHLQGQDSKGVVFHWENWQETDAGIRIATERVPAEGNVRIRFPEVATSRDVPDELFEPPTAAPRTD